MSASWVAGSIRARAMTNRRLGRAAAAQLAASEGLAPALERLARSPYGTAVRPGQGLAEAQTGLVRTTLWNVRVLAGWAPREGVTMLRVLSGAVEAANVVERAEAFAGGHDAGAPYDLGPLATAWPRLSRAGTPAELRRVLAASPWGDPGGESPREIALAVRLTVADRVIAAVPPARAWAAGWAALVVARELAARRELPPSARTAALRVLGPAAAAAVTVSHLMAALPSPARRLLGPSGAPDGPQEPDDLWRAEAGWWRVVEHDAAGLVRRATPGPEVLVGAVALLAVDAWRLRAALEIAARGGRGLEVFDAVA